MLSGLVVVAMSSDACPLTWLQRRRQPKPWPRAIRAGREWCIFAETGRLQRLLTTAASSTRARERDDEMARAVVARRSGRGELKKGGF